MYAQVPRDMIYICCICVYHVVYTAFIYYTPMHQVLILMCRIYDHSDIILYSQERFIIACICYIIIVYDYYIQVFYIENMINYIVNIEYYYVYIIHIIKHVYKCVYDYTNIYILAVRCI